MQSDVKTVGRRLRALRERLGLMQGQVAAYARVSVSYVSRLESGSISEPSALKLERIARVLNVTPEELLAPSGEGVTLVVDEEKAPILRRLLRYSSDQLNRLAETAALLFVEPVPSPDEQAEQAAHEQPQEQRQQERDQDAPSHHAQLRRLNGLTPGLQPAHLPT